MFSRSSSNCWYICLLNDWLVIDFEENPIISKRNPKQIEKIIKPIKTKKNVTFAKNEINTYRDKEKKNYNSDNVNDDENPEVTHNISENPYEYKNNQYLIKAFSKSFSNLDIPSKKQSKSPRKHGMSAFFV